MATYIDDQGFLTQDYTMDNSDVAAAMAASGGSVSRKGIPMMGMGTGAAMPGDAGSMWDPMDRMAANQNAVNTAVAASVMPGGQIGGTPYAAPVAPRNVTSQPTAGAMPPMSGVRPPIGGMPPMMPGMDPQAAAATQVNATNNAMALAAIPRDDLVHRAAFTPGGTDLYNSLAAAGHLGNAGQSSPSSLSSGLTDPDGKPLPGNQINKDMISDPRFQTLMKQDQLTGTNYAATFYQNMNGRSLAQDQAANTALMATESTNKLKDAAELQKTLTVAQTDIPSQGIRKGDLVTMQVVPGLLPGQDTVSVLPLNTYQKELANVLPDTTRDANGNVTQVMDQYGRPSYSPRGNSLLQQATGLPSAADLMYGQKLQARKQASNAAAAAAQAPSGSGHDPSVHGAIPFSQQQTDQEQSAGIFNDAIKGAGQDNDQQAISMSRFMDNAGAGVQNLANKAANFFGLGSTYFGQPSFTNSNADYLKEIDRRQQADPYYNQLGNDMM